MFVVFADSNISIFVYYMTTVLSDELSLDTFSLKNNVITRTRVEDHGFDPQHGTFYLHCFSPPRC